MVMAITDKLIVSKISTGQRSDESRHNEIDYNSLKCSVTYYVLLNVYETL